MKSIPKILLLLFVTAILPFSMASGQDKKTEKKVKIIVADKDGTKTIIDTTFTDESTPGTITLKDGKIICFDTPGSVTANISSDDGNKKIYVTTTVDDDGKTSKEEKVIIMSGEGGEWTVKSLPDTKGHIYVYDSKDEKGGKTEKHVIVASAGDKDAVWEEADGKTIHVRVDSDVDTHTDMTKYVIAKDGVVITVESKDEAKAKEIIEELEKKLDVKK